MVSQNFIAQSCDWWVFLLYLILSIDSNGLISTCVQDDERQKVHPLWNSPRLQAGNSTFKHDVHYKCVNTVRFNLVHSGAQATLTLELHKMFDKMFDE